MSQSDPVIGPVHTLPATREIEDLQSQENPKHFLFCSKRMGHLITLAT